MKAVNLWKTLFCAALALTTFSACSDDDKDDDGGMPSITVNGEASTTVAVKLDGGTTDAIEVVSTGSWVLTLDDETATWCHPSKETGSKGKTTLTFTVDPWEGAASDAERSVTAKLLTNGSFEGIPIPKKAEIIIKQNGDGSTDVTTNVKEIRALLKAMNLTESSTNVTTEIAAMTLTAIVVSDGEGNNMSNQYQIAVQDSGTEANSGLLLNATMFNTTKVTFKKMNTYRYSKNPAYLIYNKNNKIIYKMGDWGEARPKGSVRKIVKTGLQTYEVTYNVYLYNSWDKVNYGLMGTYKINLKESNNKNGFIITNMKQTVNKKL